MTSPGIESMRSKVIHRHRPGFTLMEVMFAVMILGIGLIAAGSLIPVAGGMQRSTFDQVTAYQQALSAMAIVEKVGFPDTTGWSKDGKLHPVWDLTSGPPMPMADANYDAYPLIDRSGPGGDLNGDGLIDGVDLQPGDTGYGQDIALRTQFWEPYYRWDITGRWQRFLVFFRRTEDASGAINNMGQQSVNFLFPLATPAAGQQIIGEQVLRNDGRVRLVIDASNPIPGWVGRTRRVDPAFGNINMEVTQVVGLSGATTP